MRRNNPEIDLGNEKGDFDTRAGNAELSTESFNFTLFRTFYFSSGLLPEWGILKLKAIQPPPPPIAL